MMQNTAAQPISPQDGEVPTVTVEAGVVTAVTLNMLTNMNAAPPPPPLARPAASAQSEGDSRYSEMAQHEAVDGPAPAMGALGAGFFTQEDPVGENQWMDAAMPVTFTPGGAAPVPTAPARVPAAERISIGVQVDPAELEAHVRGSRRSGRARRAHAPLVPSGQTPPVVRAPRRGPAATRITRVAGNAAGSAEEGGAGPSAGNDTAPDGDRPSQDVEEGVSSSATSDTSDSSSSGSSAEDGAGDGASGSGGARVRWCMWYLDQIYVGCPLFENIISLTCLLPSSSVQTPGRGQKRGRRGRREASPIPLVHRIAAEYTYVPGVSNRKKK